MISCVILLISVSPSFCQFDIEMGMRPDITFNEGDRFDVSAMIPKEKTYLDSQEVNRRNFVPEQIRKDINKVHKRIAALKFKKYNREFNSKLIDAVNNMEKGVYPNRERDIRYVNPAVLSEKTMSLADLLRRASGNSRGKNEYDYDQSTKGPMNIGSGKKNKGKKSTERELNLRFAVPVKIKILDMENGSLITGINIF